MKRHSFPTTPERKRELLAAIKREGGQELLDEVAMWRAQFPGAKLVSLDVGNLHVGPDNTHKAAETFTFDHPAMAFVRACEANPWLLKQGKR